VVPSKDIKALRNFFDDLKSVDELSHKFLEENFERWCKSIPKVKNGIFQR